MLSLYVVVRTSRNNKGGSAFAAHYVASAKASACSTVTTNVNSLGKPGRNNTGVRIRGVVTSLGGAIDGPASRNRITSCLAGIVRGRTNSEANLVCNVNRTMCALSSPHTMLLGRFTSRGTRGCKFTSSCGVVSLIRRLAPRLFCGCGNRGGGVYTGISLCSKLVCSVLEVPPRLFAPVFVTTEVSN